jgi:hypothetical protein
LPLKIKIVFGLCLALAGVWIYRDAMLYSVVPSPMPEQLKSHFLVTAVVCGLVVSLGWMAAFRRQNWARWALAGLFAGGRMLPLVIAASRGVLMPYLHDMVADPPINPDWYAVLGIEIAVVVLMLGPWAEDWFRKARA